MLLHVTCEIIAIENEERRRITISLDGTYVGDLFKHGGKMHLIYIIV